MKSPLIFSVLVAMAAVASSAKADLIVNGDFETGVFAPDWHPVNLDKNSGVFTHSLNTGNITPHSGTYYASLSNDGSNGFPTGSISQTISTDTGKSYDLVFSAYIEASANPGVFFQADWNGNPLLTISNPPVSVDKWVTYDFKVSGTGSDTVSFIGGNKPRYNGLDDVSLNATTVSVPGNFTMCGIAAALGLCIYGYRRRRTTPA